MRDKKMRQNDKTMSGIEKGERRRYRDGGERQEDRLGKEKKDEMSQVEDKKEERKGETEMKVRGDKERTD